MDNRIDKHGVGHHAAGSSAPDCSTTDLLLAAILLGRFSPLAPHHVGAIRERLHELNDNELREMVATGKWKVTNETRTTTQGAG